uniref:Uncharacterized protein n=1 Tax=Oryza rufipogon TaxID=4529 RepID=A0A0E0PYB5_ORYRU
MEELAELPVHRLRRLPTQVSVLPLLPSRAAADALAVVFVSPSCRPSRVEWARRLLPCFLLIGSRIENDKTSFDSFVLELQSRRLPPHLRSALSPSTTTTVAHRIASPLSPAAANRSQLDATRHLISRWSRMEVRNFNEKLIVQ